MNILTTLLLRHDQVSRLRLHFVEFQSLVWMPYSMSLYSIQDPNDAILKLHVQRQSLQIASHIMISNLSVLELSADLFMRTLTNKGWYTPTEHTTELQQNT